MEAPFGSWHCVAGAQQHQQQVVSQTQFSAAPDARPAQQSYSHAQPNYHGAEATNTNAPQASQASIAHNLPAPQTSCIAAHMLVFYPSCPPGRPKSLSLCSILSPARPCLMMVSMLIYQEVRHAQCIRSLGACRGLQLSRASWVLALLWCSSCHRHHITATSSRSTMLAAKASTQARLSHGQVRLKAPWQPNAQGASPLPAGIPLTCRRKCRGRPFSNPVSQV